MKYCEIHSRITTQLLLVKTKLEKKLPIEREPISVCKCFFIITYDCSTKGKPLHRKGQIDNLWQVKHVVTPYTAKSFLIVVYFLIVEYQGNALGCRVVVSKSYNISGGGKSYESGGCRCMEHTKSSQRDRKITPQPGNEPPRSFDRTGGKRNFRWRSFFRRFSRFFVRNNVWKYVAAISEREFSASLR